MGIWNCMGKTSLFIFGLGFYTHAALFSNSDHQTLKTQLEVQRVKVQIESFKEPSKAQIAKYRDIEQKVEAKYREMENKLDYLVKLSTTQISELNVTKRSVVVICGKQGYDQKKPYDLN